MVGMERTESEERQAALVARNPHRTACHREFNHCCVKAAPAPARGRRRPLQLLRYITALLSVSVLLASSPARSEALAAEVAYGENVRIQSLELDFDWCRTCRLAAPEHTSLAWGFAAQAMQGHRPHEANNNLFAPGSMPHLRYSWRDRNGGLFVQDGITVRLVSRPRLYNDERVCTHRDVCEVLGEMTTSF